MPTKNTFDCLPINELVQRYISSSKTSVDPFARDSNLATYTNDLNPNTNAEYHMDALDFLKLLSERDVKADVVLLDPPYSLRQMKECYENIGRKVSQRETQRFYGDLRDAVDNLIMPMGHVLSFGWNSIGMGKTRNYRIIEIKLVCHGRAHNDTICVVDQKIAKQLRLEQNKEKSDEDDT